MLETGRAGVVEAIRTEADGAEKAELMLWICITLSEIYLLEQIEIITLCSPLELDAMLFWTPPRRDQESPGYGTAILILNNAGKEKRPRRKAEPFFESRHSKAFAALYAVIHFEFHRMRSMF